VRPTCSDRVAADGNIDDFFAEELARVTCELGRTLSALQAAHEKLIPEVPFWLPGFTPGRRDRHLCPFEKRRYPASETRSIESCSGQCARWPMVTMARACHYVRVCDLISILKDASYTLHVYVSSHHPGILAAARSRYCTYPTSLGSIMTGYMVTQFSPSTGLLWNPISANVFGPFEGPACPMPPWAPLIGEGILPNS
jgi:hypothetical protein